MSGIHSIFEPIPVQKFNSLITDSFDNRLSISNPGAPRVEVNRMIDTLPVSRNNKLAEVMFYLHLCEKRGSGMNRTVASLEEKHLPPYKVVKGQEFTRVFIYPEKSYKEMTKQEKIQACYQHACLLFEDGKQMTNQSLRERPSIFLCGRILRSSNHMYMYGRMNTTDTG